MRACSHQKNTLLPEGDNPVLVAQGQVSQLPQMTFHWIYQSVHPYFLYLHLPMYFRLHYLMYPLLHFAVLASEFLLLQSSHFLLELYLQQQMLLQV